MTYVIPFLLIGTGVWMLGFVAGQFIRKRKLIGARLDGYCEGLASEKAYIAALKNQSDGQQQIINEVVADNEKLRKDNDKLAAGNISLMQQVHGI